MFRHVWGWTNTSEREDTLVLVKCKDCGSYFLDINLTGSCCKEEKKPVKRMHNNLMKFLIDRRRE